MTPPVALLTVHTSPLAESLRPRIESRGAACRVLDLEAPFTGKPVTLAPGRVVWEGCDLLAAAAVFVERPVLAWPQPLRIEGLPADETARAAAVAAEREARSLGISAIRIAADTVPVVNPPSTAYLAAAPGAALDLLSRAEVPVAPWRLEPVSIAGENDLILDAAVGHGRPAPIRPAHADPVLVLQPPPGEVAALLMIGFETAAVLGYGNARQWATGEILSEPPEWARRQEITDLAMRAVETCGLPLAEVAVGGGSTPQVILIDPAPDLAGWGNHTGGAALDALAGHLLRLGTTSTSGKRVS